jgi:hypothetical protein
VLLLTAAAETLLTLLLALLLALLLLQEDSYFAGRIVCEAEGGQLNDTAVMLEGDTGLSEGGRVHLNLSQLPAYRLFPGQVWLRRVQGGD